MSQGVVSDYLKNLISKQVDDRGLVVWYDPEQAYGDVVADLHLPNTTVARCDGSFFGLRKQIDHLLNDGQPPRLLRVRKVMHAEAGVPRHGTDSEGTLDHHGPSPIRRSLAHRVQAHPSARCWSIAPISTSSKVARLG